jgi:hypothetical protein
MNVSNLLFCAGEQVLPGGDKPKGLSGHVVPVLQHGGQQIQSASFTALQRHYTKNSKQIFPARKLLGLVPNSYIH